MAMARKLLASCCVLTLIAGFCAAALTPRLASHHPGGCPEHNQHSPRPSQTGHNCCQAGHDSALIEAVPDPRGFAIFVEHFSDAAEYAIRREPALLAIRPLPADPPDATPLRI